MEAMGLSVGIALLLLVAAVAWLIGRQSAKGVREFREWKG
jgi:hypothetical protein